MKLVMPALPTSSGSSRLPSEDRQVSGSAGDHVDMMPAPEEVVVRPDSFRRRLRRVFSHSSFGNAMIGAGVTVAVMVAYMGEQLGASVQTSGLIGLMLGALAGLAAEYALYHNA